MNLSKEQAAVLTAARLKSKGHTYDIPIAYFPNHCLWCDTAVEVKDTTLWFHDCSEYAWVMFSPDCVTVIPKS